MTGLLPVLLRTQAGVVLPLPRPAPPNTQGMMGTYLWASDVSEEKGERLQRVLGVYL